LIAVAPQGCAGDLETDSNGSVMIVPFADNIGAVERVNVSQGVQGTAFSTLVELVFWLPNELGPLCSSWAVLPFMYRIASLRAKTRISLTTVAGQSAMDLVAEGLKTWSWKRFYLSLSSSPAGLKACE
jgi:hypothetical protein